MRRAAPRPLALLAPALAAMLLGSTAPAEATSVTFRFRPPVSAETVSVAGFFNEWNPRADLLAGPDGDGVWELTLDVAPGVHQYKFVVNGNEWFTDETAEAFADDGFGGRNSVMTVGTEPMAVGDGASAGPAAPEPPSGTEVTFRWRPPDPANSVSVAGTFDGWNAAAHPMRDADGDGVWEITFRVEPGRHAYQFVVDGDDWHGDPGAAGSEDDGFGGRRAILVVGDEPLVVDATTPR